MSVLVVGGDDITAIEAVLYNLGVDKIKHYDCRRNSDSFKALPSDAGCIVMITNYLNHNAMNVFKKEAKKRDIPVIYTKHSASCVFSKYCEIFNISEKQASCIECKNYKVAFGKGC